MPKKKKTMKRKATKKKSSMKKKSRKGSKKKKSKKKGSKKKSKKRSRRKKKKKKVAKRATPTKRPSIAMAPAATPAPMPVSQASLRAGDFAPSFSVLNDQGQEIALSGLRGQKVVLYFYPKDDTPGCTKEACAFRDGISEIRAKGAVVLGVSVDDVESHKQFKEKYELNFPLLSDTQKKIVQDYGVWKEKNMYGRTFMGIERTTFLIDEAGRIARIFPKVNVEEHYNEVLAALG